MKFLTSALALSTVLSSALARSDNWIDEADEFKTFLHMLTFGQGIDEMALRRESNPLQVMAIDVSPQRAKGHRNRPVGLPKGWLDQKPGKDKTRNNGNHSKRDKTDVLKLRLKRDRKPGQMARAAARAERSDVEFKNNQSIDDLALLNFLVASEQPEFRIAESKDRSRRQVKRAKLQSSSALKAARAKRSQDAWETEIFDPDMYLSTLSETESRKPTDAKKTKKGKKEPLLKNKNKDRKRLLGSFDGKGTRNKITMSVAFGIIAAAVFAVIVQMMRLFRGNRSNAASTSARRSLLHGGQPSNTYGYERIALELDDDEEAAAAPLSAHK